MVFKSDSMFLRQCLNNLELCYKFDILLRIGLFMMRVVYIEMYNQIAKIHRHLQYNIVTGQLKTHIFG